MGDIEFRNEELTRAFVCILFSNEVVKEIARVQKLLGNWKFTGKMTDLENLHLTLKFLGEIESKKMAETKKRLRKIIFSSFQTHLERIGIFHNLGNPRIIWMKATGKQIFELQRKIDDALAEVFPPEKRFMSHLTISRIKYVKDKKVFEEHVKNIHIRKISSLIDKFFLMKSTLLDSGPVYEIVEEYSLI